MKSETTTKLLALLEEELVPNLKHLDELDDRSQAALRKARDFGELHGLTRDWTSNWLQQWDNVEVHMTQQRVLAKEMCITIKIGDPDNLRKALEIWESIEKEDAKLLDALGTIRTLTNEQESPARTNWNLLANELEGPLTGIELCLQALRIKLELLKENSTESESELVQSMRTKFSALSRPNTPKDGDALDMRNAAIQLEKEQHEYKSRGFLNLIRGLFMCFESPEERVRKNRSLTI